MYFQKHLCGLGEWLRQWSACGTNLTTEFNPQNSWKQLSIEKWAYDPLGGETERGVSLGLPGWSVSWNQWASHLMRDCVSKSKEEKKPDIDFWPLHLHLCSHTQTHEHTHIHMFTYTYTHMHTHKHTDPPTVLTRKRRTIFILSPVQYTMWFCFGSGMCPIFSLKRQKNHLNIFYHCPLEKIKVQ